MGCSSSRPENFRKITLWESQKLESETNSYDGSTTVKERELFEENHEGKSLRLEYSCDKAVNEDRIMDQKEIEQCRENLQIEHWESGDRKAEGSLSEAIDLLHLSEISERETSSSIICLNDIKEDVWDLPVRYKPGTTNKSPRNTLSFDIATASGQRNPNPWAYAVMMNGASSYNNPSGRVLIGQKAQDTLQRLRTNHYDHIYGYSWSPYERNRWHGENSSGARREYQNIYSRLDEKNCEYPEKSSAGLSTDNSACLLGKKSGSTLSTQKFMVAQLFLQTLQS